MAGILNDAPLISRRHFLASGAAAALLPSGAYSASSGLPDKIDLGPQFKKNQSVLQTQQCFPIFSHRGKLTDFKAHLLYTSQNAAGIDFEAYGDTTIVAPEKGTIIRYTPNDPQNGAVITLFHGFGFRSYIGHFKEAEKRFFKSDGTLIRDVTVERGEPLGKGANTTAKGVMTPFGPVPHIHMSMFGPIYSNYFQNVDKQDYKNAQSAVFRFPIDPEPFTPQKGCFPYFTPGILGEEHSLYAKAQKIGNEVHWMLKGIDGSLLSEEDRQKHKSLLDTINSKVSIYYFGEKKMDFHLDEKLAFIYDVARKSDKPALKDLGAQAYNLMATNLPILTSPVVRP